ncbi:hypothetical protein GCM10011583_35540 [Streptomyces camponoticapitis]|uniref:YncI copper-binding domain-containing protein n=2 Tax=Streptomyces camponoticapitis TaxID=1616125 RepID=A0ABQ2E8M4_9ACTN|nr:hypothetical protein GCM10011583_35540 [Streptomyces camponoticapitis]
MTRMSGRPFARRLSAVTAFTGLVLAASFTLAVPASAHVEVESKGASALAENVTLDFNAETESDKAGIARLEVVLPEGIEPADITYEDGPAGWKLTATDRGYSVGGPAVAAGEDVAYAVTVRQLPDAESVAFKTLQTYSDGRVDRWIELEEPAGGGHGSLAPILELAPAEPGAKPLSPTPSPEPATETPSSPAEETDTATDSAESSAADTEDEGTNTLAIVAVVVIAVACVGGGAWWFRRRSGAGTS